MSDEQHLCPKCNGAMQLDCVPMKRQSPLGGFWASVPSDYILPMSSVDYPDEVEKNAINTYRCSECVYLESYAQTRFY